MGCAPIMYVPPTLEDWDLSYEDMFLLAENYLRVWDMQQQYFVEMPMASIKKDTKTRAPQWWRHLREWKRVFWKAERRAYKKELRG